MDQSIQPPSQGPTTTLVVTDRCDVDRSVHLGKLFGADIEDRPLVVVTYDRPAERFANDWKSGVGSWPKTSAFVVVGETTRSATPQDRADEPPSSSTEPTVRGVERENDLSSLYDTVVDVIDDVSHSDRVRSPIVYFDSLDALRSNTSLETAALFLYDLRMHVLAARAEGYFVVDRTADRTMVATFASTVDDVVDVDAEGGTLRTSGRSVRRSWSGPPSGTGSDPIDHPVDEIFDALKAGRRRSALYALYRSSGPVDLLDLSFDIAARESGSDPPPEELLFRVHTSLRHVHLPKLGDLGLVRVDSDRGTVTLHDSAGAIVPFLAMAARADRW